MNYLNPKGSDKIEWLCKYGERTNKPFKHFDDSTGRRRIAVCLVDNTVFCAAGIALTRRDLEIMSKDGGRRTVWFWVLEDILRPYLEGARVEA